MIKKITFISLFLLGSIILSIVIKQFEPRTVLDEVDARFDSQCKAVDENIVLLGELVAERNKVTFLLSGMSDLVQCNQIALSLSFMSNHAYEKKAAMTLAESLMKESWSLMLANPHYAGFFDSLRELGLHRDFYFEPRRFGLKLSFWDEKVRRRPEPYVSQIRVCDGKIYCYYRKKMAKRCRSLL